jgi:hypothetical protein
VLLIAFLAVNRASLRGLERNFTFLPTVRAGDLGHLSRSSAETAEIASISVTQCSILHRGGCTMQKQSKSKARAEISPPETTTKTHLINESRLST